MIDSSHGRDLKFYCHACQQKLDAGGLEPFSQIECPVCEASLIVPMWLDNYLLEERVGTGGMASVYRALDVTLDREVAIKVLDQVDFGEEASDIFLHEARTAATINHHAIIPVYTCGHSSDGKAYIVMQYMSNGSLDDQINAHGVVPPGDAARWILNVADGLASAAKNGIVHHDVKPANIMLDDTGEAKIGDFGIANSVRSAVNDMVREKFKDWVTPNYVSPEKVLYQHEDHRGDIYSLGATLFHLLTGQTPFHHDDLQTLADMRTTVPPPVPSTLNPNIPRVLNDLVLSMLHLNPAKRPSYDEIHKILKKYVDSVRQAAARAAAPKCQIRLAVPPASGGKSKGSGGVFAVVIVIVLVIGGIVGLLWMLTQQELLTPPSDPVKPKDDGTYASNNEIRYVVDEIPNEVTAHYLNQIHSWASSRTALRFLPPVSAYRFPDDPKTNESKERYLKSLPEKERKRELACIELLGTLKPELIRMIGLLPYRTSPIIIIGYKDTEIKFRGAITANDKYLSIPIAGTEDRLANYPWEKIDKKQFATFLRHYADLRREDGNNEAAAKGYLKLAVYLDWIAAYDEAAAALQDAIKLHPPIRTEALTYFAKH